MRLKKLIVFAVAAAIGAAGCAGYSGNSKNLAGRYYHKALDDMKYFKFSQFQSKLYGRKFKDTIFKKHEIIGKCIATDMAKSVPDKSYTSVGTWKIRILNDNDVKVAAFGDNTMFISQGLLEKYDFNQDIVAFHIAHVEAHSVLGHTNERLDEVEVGVTGTLGSMIESDEDGFQDMSLRIAGAPLDDSKIIPYSEEMEEEADLIALNILALAGYRPNQSAISMQAEIGSEDDTYSKQHKITQERFDKLMYNLQATEHFQEIAKKRGYAPQCENLQ